MDTITVPKINFNKAIDFIKGGVGLSANIFIYFVKEDDKGYCVLIGRDHSYAVSCRMELDDAVEFEHPIYLSYTQIKGFVNNLKEKTIEFKELKKKHRISSGAAVIDVPLHEEAIYEKGKYKLYDDFTCQIQLADVSETSKVAKALYAVSIKSANEILKSIQIIGTEDSVCWNTTDGYRMAQCKFKDEFVLASEDVNFIVPIKIMGLLGMFGKSTTYPLSIGSTKDHFVIEVNVKNHKVAIYGPKMSGQYPDIDKLLSSPPEELATVDFKTFASQVNIQCSTNAKSKVNYGGLTFDKSECKIESFSTNKLVVKIDDDNYSTPDKFKKFNVGARWVYLDDGIDLLKTVVEDGNINIGLVNDAAIWMKPDLDTENFEVIYVLGAMALEHNNGL